MNRRTILLNCQIDRYNMEMSEISTCTIVFEFNYTPAPYKGAGSVWLCNGDGKHDLQRTLPPDKAPNWIKIVGPIDCEVAAGICDALKKFFEDNGVFVIDEGVPD